MGLLQVTSISASKYNLSSFPTMNDEGFICRHRSSLKLMPSKPKDDELEILANSISLKSSLSLQYPIPFFPSSSALTNHHAYEGKNGRLAEDHQSKSNYHSRYHALILPRYKISLDVFFYHVGYVVD